MLLEINNPRLSNNLKPLKLLLRAQRPVNKQHKRNPVLARHTCLTRTRRTLIRMSKLGHSIMRREGKILLVLFTFSQFRVSRMRPHRNLSLCSQLKHNLSNLNSSSSSNNITKVMINTNTNNTNLTRVLPSTLTVLLKSIITALRVVLNNHFNHTHQNNNLNNRLRLRLARTMLIRPAVRLN